MTGDPPVASEERSRASFAAIILLLREIAHGLLRERRLAEARGLIDGLEALRAKAKGNLDAEEEHFLSDVMYDLQLAAVKAADAAKSAAPESAAPDAPASGPSRPDPSRPETP